MPRPWQGLFVIFSTFNRIHPARRRFDPALARELGHGDAGHERVRHGAWTPSCFAPPGLRVGGAGAEPLSASDSASS